MQPIDLSSHRTLPSTAQEWSVVIVTSYFHESYQSGVVVSVIFSAIQLLFSLKKTSLGSSVSLPIYNRISCNSLSSYKKSARSYDNLQNGTLVVFFNKINPHVPMYRFIVIFKDIKCIILYLRFLTPCQCSSRTCTFW